VLLVAENFNIEDEFVICNKCGSLFYPVTKFLDYPICLGCKAEDFIKD